MDERVRVAVHAQDPLTQAGITSQLRTQPQIRLATGHDETPDPQVVVVAADILDENTLQTLQRLLHRPYGVLIASELAPHQLVRAAECGVQGVLWRAEATAERLVEVITTVARGGGYVPAGLLGQLLSQARLHFTGLGLTERETDILRLTAEGYDTAAIAIKLNYSERTIKNDLHAVMTRYGLRSRPHAVAYAIRHGYIFPPGTGQGA
ncbi:response regulator transcription factor [Streptomyces sp. NPDC056244]|uniref:helix-turn-helix transcriptional regulator n=1 Tax=Streptomyces sp. NPDC056244 TaxID=3345762 RepID=UPI0035DAAE6E